MHSAIRAAKHSAANQWEQVNAVQTKGQATVICSDSASMLPVSRGSNHEPVPESIEQVRSRIRTMARISILQPITQQQAQQWREQLRTGIQNMNRDQQSFINGLNPDQKAAVQSRTREMQLTDEQFEKMSDALDTELALESPDPVKVRQQARQMGSTMDKIRTQQQQLSDDLGRND